MATISYQYDNLKNYIREQYDIDELRDIANHGCSGGVSGLIYYNETSDFYDKFESEIWDLLWEMAESFGDKNALALIAGFNGADNVCSDASFKNLLAWAAVEEIARQIVDELDEQGGNDNENI